MILSFDNIETPEAILVGNGCFPIHEGVRALMARTPYIICCDGAADVYYKETGKMPDAVVGDGDSLSDEGRLRFADRLHIITEQEHNDQSKAIRFLKEKGIRRVVIVSATGKREDHTLGNISLLIEYMRLGMEICMFTDYGVFRPCRNSCSFDSFQGQQVSIFSFGAANMTSRGLKYPLHDLFNWWEGTLNEACDTSFDIMCTGEYIVFQTFR